jgi:hypothetical protein
MRARPVQLNARKPPPKLVAPARQGLRGGNAGWRRLRACGGLRSPHTRDIEAADIEKHVCASHVPRYRYLRATHMVV